VKSYAVLGYSAALLAVTVVAQASTITYDLQGDWSNSSNSNGVWSYMAGSSLLPFQNSSSCYAGVQGFGGGWAPSPNLGDCIPTVFQATANASNPNDWQTGDILLHSYDSANGGSNGQVFVTWTAPVSGTITYTGGIWYAHSAVQRSDDFYLTYDATTLQSGTVAYNSAVGSNRSNQLTFSGGSMSVNAGDVIALELVKSETSPYGALAGVNLTINETSGPEPGTFWLIGGACGLLAVVPRRRA